MEALACLSGSSAAAYWREIRLRVARDNAMDPDDPAFEPLLIRLLSREPCALNLSAMPPRLHGAEIPSTLGPQSVREARSLNIFGEADSIELVVNSPQGRRYFGGIALRVFSHQIPAESLCSVSCGLLAPSPEMTLLLVSSHSDAASLARLVCEFCGLYSLAGGKFVSSPQLTCLSSINQFVTDVEGLAAAGGKRAPVGLPILKKALDMSVDRSASPAETACALLLSVSRRQGGYGLPKPQMNQSVKAGGKEHVCDLVWPDERTVLEYQSDLHGNSPKRLADRNKLNALQAAGYAVLQAGKEDLKQLRRADELASLLCDALVVPQLRASESFRKRQAGLRRVLLAGWWGEDSQRQTA